ncbi:hypothetical protein QWI17_09740 [Gilvimarinus sp. SDUM040013]|uniref:Ribosomal protein L7/L12 C-terminal domain-containing protein n=1 Tax=Gilvimarinus gilvus TaxID=3058038 RepID=A0ABU4S3F7_9GAMM|nr:hypothetical protein [Gilvimarinus sp. SDUM040013]MDO3386116.1 hypothetical protein [Gilvimarinus sp. SDUM040013]MDX6850343.1 hypothetical protein [Gilvimarinus sp. SDUM040013]
MEQEKTTYDIIFRGDIVLGHSLNDVKQRLQQLFKADAAKIEALFTGRPVPLKRNLDEATARKYQAVLQKAGAEVSVKVAGATQSPASRPEPVPRKRQLSLAPAGENLLRRSERQKADAVEIDTSTLTLRAVEGNLLDQTEVAPEPVAAVVTPEFDLAEVGADLVSENERQTIPLPTIEPESWGLSEVGEDLLRPEETEQPDVVVVKELAVELAPVGSDMGELKEDKPAVNPDTSQLKLEDR